MMLVYDNGYSFRVEYGVYSWYCIEEVAAFLKEGVITKADIKYVCTPWIDAHKMEPKELDSVQWARIMRKQRRNVSDKMFIKLMEYVLGR